MDYELFRIKGSMGNTIPPLQSTLPYINLTKENSFPYSNLGMKSF